MGGGGEVRGNEGAGAHRQAPRRLLPVAHPHHRAQREEQPPGPGRGEGGRRGLPPGRYQIRVLPVPLGQERPCYGTPAYNDFFCEQLTELLTGYGDIFYVWFDNACGEGPNGKKQEYDFPRYFELIRKYQPGAVIFNDFGPDVRWCGNEAGTARYAEWAVVPTELCHYAQAQTGPGPLAGEGDLSCLYNTAQEIGAMPNILYSKGLAFVPAEIDMSIRPGWFWHPNEEPHSLERLFRTTRDLVWETTPASI